MSEMDALIKQLEAAIDDGSASNIALVARSSVNAAFSFLYRAAGWEVPVEESFLERMSGEPVLNFLRELDSLPQVDLIGKIGARALQSHRITKKQADTVAQLALDFLAEVRLHVESAAPITRIRRTTVSEAITRKVYIDYYLQEAKWEIETKEGNLTPGKACIEVKVEGLPPNGQPGFCDYVLFDEALSPLAVIEGKKTSRNPVAGDEQVHQYADALERQFGLRPVIYTTNGYEILCDDGLYPNRQVYAFHTKDELSRMIHRRGRKNIAKAKPNPDIVNRPYQITAIQSLCDHFNTKHRKGLLVMATGTGKTRVAISLVDELSKADWAQHVLFLADRRELVTQAYNSFTKHLPNLSSCKLSEKHKKGEEQNRLVLSTYQTMINYVDDPAKPFTSGRFDLIIIDEAHRSIFNKYSSIFYYFDALLVGLTATPREDVDSNTYSVFDCEQGAPNFDYSLAQAVKEHFLVPYRHINRTTKDLRDGIRYEDLTDEQRTEYEDQFEQAGYEGTPEKVTSKQMFAGVYNQPTVDAMLQDLMEHGLKVDSGETLGKTIIFAARHDYADKIVKRFKALYPDKPEVYCQLIDNQVEHSDKRIEKFREGQEMRIAVSVDMLDTGVDVPDVLNLVFFRPVHSKIKFWQMIGRGTRLSPNVFGPGQDKKEFYAFDYFGNFDFFSVPEHGQDPIKEQRSLSQRIFNTRLRLMMGLQTAENQELDWRREFWKKLRETVFEQVKAAASHRYLTSVKVARPHLDKYLKLEDYIGLSSPKLAEIDRFITPLVTELKAEPEAIKLFDSLMLRVELVQFSTGKVAAAKNEIMALRKMGRWLLDNCGAVPEVLAHKAELELLAGTDFWNVSRLENFEQLRTAVRSLAIYYKPASVKDVGLHIPDVLIELGPVDGIDIRSYREKIVDYLARHNDLAVIRKVKSLEPINAYDLRQLEHILWEELGTKEDYDNEQYEGSIAGFIRSIAGLDEDAVQRRFGEFLYHSNLNARQQEFVSELIDYLRQNGEVTADDLTNDPFFESWDLIADFSDKQPVLKRIVNTIKTIFPTDLEMRDRFRVRVPVPARAAVYEEAPEESDYRLAAYEDQEG